MRSVIITAITLFALSGAILGFAVGAFTHHPKSPQLNTQQLSAQKPQPTTIQTTPTVVTTPTVTAQPVGCPTMSLNATQSTAGTVYTVTVQAKAKTATGCNDPRTEPNITNNSLDARIWLVKNNGKNPEVKEDAIKVPGGLNDPANFPGEITGGLQFEGTAQVQKTDNNGVTTWNVTLSPDLHKGNYRIVAMNAWGGIFFNWSWLPIVVTK